jgi:hypothetical protein
VIITDEKIPSVLMHGSCRANQLVSDLLNEIQLPVDILTSNGRSGRKQLGLKHLPENVDRQLSSTCVPILSQESKSLLEECLADDKPYILVCPMVVVISNAYSEDFKMKYLEVVNGLK